MKTLAAIKNELFKDYLKIVSTDNLEATLDNPSVPMPFVCVAKVENQNADVLVNEINKFFNHKKLNNKDFICVDSDDINQLNFLFNLISLSGGGATLTTASAIETISKVDNVVAPIVIEKSIPKEVVVDKVEEKVETPVVEKQKSEADAMADAIIQSAIVHATEEVVEEEKSTATESETLIESLGIPKNSLIHFIKSEVITASIIDEKTVVYEGEQLPIVDATKRAFKKAGVTGMALGLSNWNYEGTSLKALKEKK